MSPCRPSFSPQLHVYPKTDLRPPVLLPTFLPNSFAFSSLRTLKLSCAFFRASRPLFSIACARFDRNARGVHMPRIRFRSQRSTNRLLLPFFHHFMSCFFGNSFVYIAMRIAPCYFSFSPLRSPTFQRPNLQTFQLSVTLRIHH